MPVGLNDGSMKHSLVYAYPPVLFEPWVNLIFEYVHCLAVHCILTHLVPSIHYSMCEEIFPLIQPAVLFENGQRVISSASVGAQLEEVLSFHTPYVVHYLEYFD